MSVEFFVKDTGFPIASFYAYNKFLNWVGSVGDFPVLLSHSPIDGIFDFSKSKLLLRGNVTELYDELFQIILEQVVPIQFEDIVNRLFESCVWAKHLHEPIYVGNPKDLLPEDENE